MGIMICSYTFYLLINEKHQTFRFIGTILLEGIMENSMNLHDIFKILKKRWKLILLMTLVAGLISGAVTYYLLTPVYQASTQILVNQKDSENRFDSSLLRSNVDLISTYSMIIKSPAILGNVIKDLDFTESVEELNQNITINSQDNSQVFFLTVEDSNAGRAVEIANSVSETFQQDIQGIMNVDNVSILAKAELKENPIPVSPKPILNIAIAVVVGLMTGIGIAFLLEFMDSTLKDEQDVAAYLGLPVLGSIQKMSRTQKKERKGSSIQKTGSETIVS
jgi:capsular polysaccharide biosynthesis protein